VEPTARGPAQAVVVYATKGRANTSHANATAIAATTKTPCRREATGDLICQLAVTLECFVDAALRGGMRDCRSLQQASSPRDRFQ